VLVRVLTFNIPERNVGEANVRMRTLLDELRQQQGLAYAKLARRFLGGSEEMVLFEEWRTPADLFRWTHGRLQHARLPEGMGQLYEDLVITHYESLDVSLEDLELDVISSKEHPEPGVRDRTQG
jgi:hypothetical protein